MECSLSGRGGRRRGDQCLAPSSPVEYLLPTTVTTCLPGWLVVTTHQVVLAGSAVLPAPYLPQARLAVLWCLCAAPISASGSG